MRAFLCLLLVPSLVAADPTFVCASRSLSGLGPETVDAAPADDSPRHKAAAPAATPVTGTLRAVVLFAHFRGETADTEPPTWAADLFDPEHPGSFRHFYDAMSLGRLRVDGQVLPRQYVSLGPASAYTATSDTARGRFGDFVLEILRQADAETDFAHFDADGPDGLPDSGDDDGYVDAVFVDLLSSPRGFLVGGATGIYGLGFANAYVTDDVGAGGVPIRIDPQRGSVQRTRTFVEAAGSMAHEFGHVLGLPDLYDTAYLARGGPPADDSAGIGNWGLMGWGADGWHGDDGPAALSAWSRWRLGWARVTTIADSVADLRLGAVGLAGDVFRIPISASEAFLLEHRSVGTTYYDRNIPAGGLLVWHIGQDPKTAERRVDLECADGRWRDAGFPVGTVADPVSGGDNLDFWAHDDTYRATHGGNLGDATNPFDGIRYTEFTPDTNPAALSLDGTRSLRIEAIRVDGDTIRARVHTAPPHLIVVSSRVQDAGGDNNMGAGEEGDLQVIFFNDGGALARDVRIRAVADDSLLEVVRAEADLGDIEVGRSSRFQLSDDFPRVRTADALEGVHDLPFHLDLTIGDRPAGRRDLTFRAASTFRLSGRLVDTRGAPARGISDLRALALGDATGIRIAVDADGRFATDLRPGHYVVYAYRGIGPNVPRVVDLSGDRDVDIVLPDLTEVEVDVADEDGTPVDTWNLLASAPTALTFAQSLGSGHYLLQLPRGRFILSAGTIEDGDRVFPAQGLGELVVGGPSQTTFTLRRGRLVTFRVHADGPEPVVGGAYAWSSVGPAVNLSVAVNPSLLMAPGAYLLSGDLEPPDLLRPQVFRVADADTTIVLPVERGIAVHGTVRDGGAVPSAAPWLWLAPFGDGQPLSLRLRADGAFDTHVLPGRYEVAWAPDSLGSTPAQVLATVDLRGDRYLDFDLPALRPFRGRLRAASGPLPTGLTIEAHGLSQLGVGRAEVAANGLFDLTVEPGRYALYADDGRNRWALGEADLPADLDLLLPGGALYRGRILQPDDTPADGALVVLGHEPLTLMQRDAYGPHRFVPADEGFVAAARTGPDGTFELAAPPGAYVASILPASRAGLGVTRAIALSDTVDADIRLPLPPPAGELVGRIHYGDGPRGRVVLRFHDPVRDLFYGQRVQGDVYLIRAPTGTWRVRAGVSVPVRGYDRVVDLGTITVDASRTWDIDLTGAPTAVEEGEAAVPGTTHLEPAFPNPFNGGVTLNWRLAAPGHVRLSLYNILGQRVRTLLDEDRPAGHHTDRWDGADDTGRALGTGVYFVHLQAPGTSQVQRLLLLK